MFFSRGAPSGGLVSNLESRDRNWSQVANASEGWDRKTRMGGKAGNWKRRCAKKESEERGAGKIALARTPSDRCVDVVKRVYGNGNGEGIEQLVN